MVWRDPALDGPTLRRFRRLRAVIRIGVGVDSVDMAAAGALGRGWCCHSPQSPTVNLSRVLIASLKQSVMRCADLLTAHLGALGIAVCNVPAYGTEEVADSALAHLLNL
jgi:lactate dehydrogenase-like 2-hydroxyacid dehydrogenase